MKPLVKICGLMRAEDVALCCGMGVDICGFVVEYPVEVPWNLPSEACGQLLARVSPPAKSCIVTGGPPEKVLSLARKLKPDLVQLHYRETLADTKGLVRALAPYGIGVIKAIPADPAERAAQFGMRDLEGCVRALSGAGVYAILADSRGASNAATGGALDLPFCRQVQATAGCPVAIGGRDCGGQLPKDFRGNTAGHHRCDDRRGNGTRGKIPGKAGRSAPGTGGLPVNPPHNPKDR